MAIGERIGTMIVLEEERPAVISEPDGLRLAEYTILLGVMALLTAFAIAFFYFSANIESLKSYGYAGLFLINIIGAASIRFLRPRGRRSWAGARCWRTSWACRRSSGWDWSRVLVRRSASSLATRRGTAAALSSRRSRRTRESMTGCRSAASSRCS